MTDQELATEMAGMEKDCPYCAGYGYSGTKGLNGENLEAPCSACKGTGKVPVFEGVRVKCPECDGSGQEWSVDNYWKIFNLAIEEAVRCHLCQGRGYVGSLDEQVWKDAIFKLPQVGYIITGLDGIEIRSKQEDELMAYSEGTDLAALLNAAKEVADGQ